MSRLSSGWSALARWKLFDNEALGVLEMIPDHVLELLGELGEARQGELLVTIKVSHDDESLGLGKMRRWLW